VLVTDSKRSSYHFQ